MHSDVVSVCVRVQVLKLMAEMSPFCGDMEKLEANLNMLFSKLLVRTPSHAVRSRRSEVFTHASSFHFQPVLSLVVASTF